MTADGLKPWQQLLIFLLVAAAVVSRRPDAFFHPQFYAEDGAVWYAQAYNLGWFHALSISAGGYLNTLPRLAAALALLVPLAGAPAVLNLFGIVLQALPVTVLLSSRCAAWGSLPLRALQAAMYVALPNSNEIDVTITNAHWHLALVVCLIAFATPPRTLSWKLFDVAACLVGGLTGPWAIVLTPLTLIFWWMRRDGWTLLLGIVFSFCALIQIAELATSPARPVTPLGATPELMLRLIAGNIFLGAIWGQNSFVSRAAVWSIAAVFLLGSALLFYCFLKSNLERRLFTAFCALILAASLASPLIQGSLPRWQLLAIDKGGRYWFFPMLALLWSLAWCAAQKSSQSARVAAILLLLISLRGIWRDWHYWPYKDEHFALYVDTFKRASPGTKMTIPIYPDGHAMELIKK